MNQDILCSIILRIIDETDHMLQEPERSKPTDNTSHHLKTVINYYNLYSYIHSTVKINKVTNKTRDKKKYIYI